MLRSWIATPAYLGRFWTRPALTPDRLVGCARGVRCLRDGFDPHPEGPPGRHSQRSKPPRRICLVPQRALQLIDLTGPGAVRHGASHKINSGPKGVARRWARAIRAAWPDADGLLYASSMTGEEAVTLWAPAQETFAPAPAFASLIGSPVAAWRETIQDACRQLGYDWITDVQRRPGR